MDISLKDKVAIITGGTRGIGFAMVKKFVEAQAKVVIWGSRIETAKAALEKLREAFPDCEAMAMAPVLTDQKQVKEAMELVTNTPTEQPKDSKVIILNEYPIKYMAANVTVTDTGMEIITIGKSGCRSRMALYMGSWVARRWSELGALWS